MKKGRSPGFALVIVLCLVVIVSVILIAFVTVMRMDLQATQSYSQSLRAEQIAEGAFLDITDSLFDEITAGSVRYGASGTVGDTNKPYIYLPTNAAAMLPQLSGVSGLTNAWEPLRKISRSGVPFFPGGASLASAANTASRSANGRLLSLSRWNKPRFHTNWPVAVAPDWVNVTRSGPANVSVTDARDSALSNTNFVIGRYAYAIYDTGGLLDITLAGHPGTNTGLPSGFLARKGHAALADLTQIPNGPANLTAPQVNDLIDWRNAATKAAYQTFITNFLSINGGLTVHPGDNTFVSRQDLIRYAQAKGLTNALPYFTTFHRSLNAPSWFPATPGDSSTDYAGRMNDAAAINRFFPNVRVKTEFTRADGTVAKVGEPLVKQRFPLSRLALLGEASPDADKIKRYFGLSRAASAGKNESWTYDHGDPNRVMDLDEVAAAGREPDFFELLKAAILEGSLGKSPGLPPVRPDGTLRPEGSPGVGSNVDEISSNLSLQVLRIGANLIDQYDADSFPMAIYCQIFAPADSEDNTVHGIEDLPYFWRIAPFTMDTTPPEFPPPLPPGPAYHRPPACNARIWLQPILWNPHQTGTSPSQAPSKLRIQAFGGSRLWVTYFYTKSTGTRDTDPDALGPSTEWAETNPVSGPSLSAPGFSCIEFSAAQDFRSTPVLLTKNNVDTAKTPAENLPSLHEASWPAGQNQAGFAIPGYPWTPDSTTLDTNTRLVTFQWRPDTTASFALQYEDEGGVWRTYSIIRRIYTRIHTQVSINNGGKDYPGVFGHGRNGDWFQVYDARTDRFGVSVPTSITGGYAANSTYRPAVTPASGYSFIGYPPRGEGFSYDSGYDPANPSSGPFTPGTLTRNFPESPAPAKYMYYSDPDGVVRGADGRFASSATFPHGYPLALSPSNGSQRPIILNRPFRSVGELGYAFRDLPFKTLDFFTDESGDAGLLDVFCVDEASMAAGKINPNIAPAEVLAAVIAGGLRKESDASKTTSADTVAIASHLRSQLDATPAMHRGALVAALGNNLGNAVTAAEDKANKTQREAPMRSLVEVADTRTWNLMIDLVAQAGRYPVGATDPDAFVVEAEKRYWLHLAIDRFTGEVISRRLEPVYE